VGGEGKKLIRGLRLRLFDPELAARDCESCAKYHYQDGEIVRRPHKIGLPVLRVGEPPCNTCPKIPGDEAVKHRKYAVHLSEENEQAWEFYLECKAVGDFPCDPIVRRWAGLIRRLEDARDRNAIAGRLDALPATLAAILLGASRGR
jgi:hypothetical protein